jgi:hypothetical protein
MDVTKKGIRLQTEGDRIVISNNRRCRVMVEQTGHVIPASTVAIPQQRASFLRADFPHQNVSCVLEIEGARGPQPDKDGEFTPSSQIVSFDLSEA